MELCMGDPANSDNPFQWETVWLNLPFMPGYDPSMPRVILLRRDGEMAIRKVVFVDDIHDAGCSTAPELITQAQRWLAKWMNYYVNQDAAKKRRHASGTPGAWNGVIIHCDQPFHVKATTYYKKWKRGVDALQWLWNQFNIPENANDPIGYLTWQTDWNRYVDTAELRRMAGLWIHITEVYTKGRCFLKGFFNAIEAFRKDRDLDGWRLLDVMNEELKLEIHDASRDAAAADYPLTTRVTYELVSHHLPPNPT